jgi:E3 ubiquitin-protein ligase MARCH6
LDAADSLPERKAVLVESGQLVTDGTFVRTPASDQVRIPKGRNVFLMVDENDQRTDGKTTPAGDLYGAPQYQLVYVPPQFPMRIFLFILFIWIFAAVTGVGFTIIPLTVGRRIFQFFLPNHVRTNDIYAFSIGIYVLGTLAYAIFHARSISRKVNTWTTRTTSSIYSHDLLLRAAQVLLQGAKLLYTYSILLIVFPVVVTTIMELYLLIPLHTYIYPPTGETPDANSRHTIRVVQAWTLGLLYLRLGARFLTSLYEGTRIANAVNAVFRHGWLTPDVAVLTRAFVLPGLALSLTAIFLPLLLASTFFSSPYMVGTLVPDAFVTPSGKGMVSGAADVVFQVDPGFVAMGFRVAYPVTAVLVLALLGLWSVVSVFGRWRVRIKDEAYLIGERLHNFGGSGRGRWRGGQRL